jgi:hypothetical protein
MPVILNEVKDLSVVSCYDGRLPGDCCGRRSFATLRMTVLFHAALAPAPGMSAQDDPASPDDSSGDKHGL